MALTAIVSASGAQLLPVDEAATQPAFYSFRAGLQTAVARHDVEAVMAVVHPRIKNSFGGDDGADAFRRKWNLRDPDSALWQELGAVLALGGSFQGDNTFVAPYTFSHWPDQYDSFTHVVLVASDVRVHEAPRADSRTVTTASFAILPLDNTARAVAAGWTAVRLDDGRGGYVDSRLVRSPVGYRAFFTRSAGSWQLTLFVAGD